MRRSSGAMIPFVPSLNENVTPPGLNRLSEMVDAMEDEIRYHILSHTRETRGKKNTSRFRASPASDASASS